MAVSRAGKRRDHAARLWERRTEVYEAVLCQVDWWRKLREKMAQKVRFDEVTPVEPPP
jgi:hypothetical protein